MNFGERLKQARTNLGLTQESVATELFVSRQTISSWENERSYPDIKSLISLSNYYQLSLDILLKEDNGMVEEMKRKEELAKITKIWGLSYGMNLIFLLIILVSQFTKIQSFNMGQGIRISLIMVMLLNVSLLIYVTNEKRLLSGSTKVNCFEKSLKIKVIIGLEVVFLLVSLWLLFINYQQASHILGIATGMLSATVLLMLISNALIKKSK